MISKDIHTYNLTQSSDNKDICEHLAQAIDDNLADATNKLWHGGPVWFIDENPVVGYWVRKAGVALLFWSGQSFDEPGLSPEGKFKAAQVKYHEVSQIDNADLARWLQKAHDIQWDYKNIIKNKGQLYRIDPS